jgi:hypothetical protein
VPSKPSSAGIGGWRNGRDGGVDDMWLVVLLENMIMQRELTMAQTDRHDTKIHRGKHIVSRRRIVSCNLK